MTVHVETATELPAELSALGVLVSPGTGGGALAILGDLAGTEHQVGSLLGADGVEDGWLRRQGFAARLGQSLVLRRAGGPPSVVLLGLGSDLSLPEAWRRAGAALVRAAGEGGTAAVLLPSALPGTDAELAAALTVGAVLGTYRFTAYRSSPKPPPVERLVVVTGSDDVITGVRHGMVTGGAVAFARDLVNTPPSDLPPRVLAARAVEQLTDLPFTSVEVWDESRIAAERLGGLVTVARGSTQPPRLVFARYEPDGSADGPHVVLVGKGITFDSGGLSLKTADGMVTMKTDMSGAAVVLGALSACAGLGIGIKVTAIAPMTENMPDGNAVKPGDVFTARNGLTVEVLNTDAEGRLILADGLSLATELHPDAIIDVATLTGAARVALGSGVAPVLGNDDALLAAVHTAGERAGERLWPLPLPEDYGDQIDSDVADMKNTGRAGEAGVIAAAMLLARFVDSTPWAHLDIAGTGRSGEESGYLTKGGTAFGLRTLLDLLANFDAVPAVAVAADDGQLAQEEE